MAETGGKGSNREMMVNIGFIMLAVSLAIGGIAFFMKNRKQNSEKTQ